MVPGSGWLTVKVGAVNAKDGRSDLCDSAFSFTNSIVFYDKHKNILTLKTEKMRINPTQI